MTVKLKMGTITELISIKIKFLFIIDDSHFDFRQSFSYLDTINIIQGISKFDTRNNIKGEKQDSMIILNYGA